MTKSFKLSKADKRASRYDNRVPLETRFWRNVKKTRGCWWWKQSMNKNAYGAIGNLGKREKAHRMSWMLHYGDIPDGKLVLHKCDNPACVRPDHLFVGTQRINLLDSVAKGRYNEPARGSKGEKNGSAKLTVAQVRRIRKVYPKIKNFATVGNMFGVCNVQVKNIVRRKAWSHVK